ALLLPGSSSSYRKLLAYPLSFSYPVFMFNAPPTTAIYTLSLHDALPISGDLRRGLWLADGRRRPDRDRDAARERRRGRGEDRHRDRKSTRLNSSHVKISYAVFCLKKKKKRRTKAAHQNRTDPSQQNPQRP